MYFLIQSMKNLIERADKSKVSGAFTLPKGSDRKQAQMTSQSPVLSFESPTSKKISYTSVTSLC